MGRSDPFSGDLFAIPKPAPAVAGSMDFRALVSAMVSDMLQRSGVDRYEISSRISRLTNKDVSKWMLDGYTSEARDEFNVPAWLIPALEVACNTHAYTEWLAGVRGGRVLIGEEALHHDISRLEQIRDEADAAVKALRQRVRGRR